MAFCITNHQKSVYNVSSLLGVFLCFSLTNQQLSYAHALFMVCAIFFFADLSCVSADEDDSVVLNLFIDLTCISVIVFILFRPSCLHCRAVHHSLWVPGSAGGIFPVLSCQSCPQRGASGLLQWTIFAVCCWIQVSACVAWWLTYYTLVLSYRAKSFLLLIHTLFFIYNCLLLLLVIATCTVIFWKQAQATLENKPTRFFE